MTRALYACLLTLILGAFVGAAIAGDVPRAQFTSAIDSREPVDELEGAAAADLSRLYFFTELRDLEGQTVTHRWTYDGDTMAEVSFTPEGARWRVWSSKELLPQWTGTWTVEVVDAAGNVLSAKSIDYR